MTTEYSDLNAMLDEISTGGFKPDSVPKLIAFLKELENRRLADKCATNRIGLGFDPAATLPTQTEEIRIESGDALVMAETKPLHGEATEEWLEKLEAEVKGLKKA